MCYRLSSLIASIFTDCAKCLLLLEDVYGYMQQVLVLSVLP
jgi:hypothetical protein